MSRKRAQGGGITPPSTSDDSVVVWLPEGESWVGPEEALNAGALSRHVAGIEPIPDRFKVRSYDDPRGE